MYSLIKRSGSLSAAACVSFLWGLVATPTFSHFGLCIFLRNATMILIIQPNIESMRALACDFLKSLLS